MTNSSVVLEAREIGKSFGGMTALSRLNLEVKRGECLAIIGPNGAGKTTFFNLLTGLLRPSTGRIFFEGADITGYPPDQRTALGISRTMQITSIFPRLSVLDNILIGVQAQHSPWNILRYKAMSSAAMKQRAHELTTLVGLHDRAGEICANLAYGDQRLVELALALSIDATLLLLDEPTAGLSPTETRHVTTQLANLHKRGKLTILIVEHDMEVAMGLATRVAVFHLGRCLATGDPDTIMQDETVNRAYLRGPTCVEA